MEQEPTAISLPSESLLPRELERLSDEEFWQFACERANSAGESVHHVHREEYVECMLDDGVHRCWLALDALCQALPPPEHFALLPAMPPWMIGLLAWRGETLAVIDFAAYLADSQQASTGQILKGKLVVINDASGKRYTFPSLALFVADIGQSMTLAHEQIEVASVSAEDATALSSDWPAPVRTAIIRGNYNNAPVLDVSALLADIVERIGIAALDE